MKTKRPYPAISNGRKRLDLNGLADEEREAQRVFDAALRRADEAGGQTRTPVNFEDLAPLDEFYTEDVVENGEWVTHIYRAEPRPAPVGERIH